MKIRKTLARAVRVLFVLSLLAAACLLYSFFVEPHWLAIRHIRVSEAPRVRILHITDIHFKGDAAFLQKVVDTLNVLDADAVCFTGDLVEESEYLHDSLALLQQVNKPVYGIPGNHDGCFIKQAGDMEEAFRKMGGQWLSSGSVNVRGANLQFVTSADAFSPSKAIPVPNDTPQVLLVHNPDVVDRITGRKFDLILAGHTHGGQIHVPLLGKRVLPFDVGKYDRGLFITPAGPLYVNPGLGTFHFNMRFCCRPEITVIEL